MTIKGISVKVNIEFGLEEMEISESDFKAMSEADVASDKMHMIRRSATSVMDDMSYESKQSLGQVIVDTISKELGTVVKEQFGGSTEAENTTAE